MNQSLNISQIAEGQGEKVRFINDNFNKVDSATQGNLEVPVSGNAFINENDFKNYSTFILKVPTGTTLSTAFTLSVPNVKRNFNILNLTNHTCTVQVTGAQAGNVSGTVAANTNSSCHSDGSLNAYIISGGSSSTPTPMPTPPAPVITSFAIQNQSQTVDIGFTLQGSKTFVFTVENSQNVEGDLTLSQAGVATALSTTVDATGASVSVPISPAVTFTAGQTLTFTLSGTATAAAGGAAFSRTYTITAAQATDYIYIDFVTAKDLSSYTAPTDSRRVRYQAGSQDLTIPNSSSAQAYLAILQRESDPNITSIFFDGLNQIGAFTRQPQTTSLNGVDYEAWISNNLFIVNDIRGATITINR